jgi:hypothetical protein
MKTICPKCMEESAICVDLADGDTLTCAECDEEYSLGAVIDLVESWGRLLPWLRSHPARAAAGTLLGSTSVPV